MWCVGLTGGIGSGKSTVARCFADLAVCVIDTDVISHALTQIDAAGWHGIRKTFGTDVFLPDHGLDRAKLRGLVCSDPAAKKKLEALLHPMILAQVRAEVSQCRAPYAIIVVPLLFETGGYRALVQRTLVVDCSEATQIERTMTRSHWQADEVRAIMAQQWPRQRRLQAADDVIQNEGGLAALAQAVSALHARYLALAAATQ